MADNGVAIRVATLEDAAGVEHLLTASYTKLMPPAYDEAVMTNTLPLICQANPNLLSSGTYFIVQVDGIYLACGGWTKSAPGSDEIIPGVGHVRHFATHPNAIGRGFGSSILNRCKAEALHAGRTALECFSSLNAEDFYASHGFIRQGRVDIYLPNDAHFPAILMRCKLDQY